MPGLIRPDALWLVVEPVDVRPGDRLLALTAEQWRWRVAGVDWQRRAVPPPAGATR